MILVPQLNVQDEGTKGELLGPFGMTVLPKPKWDLDRVRAMAMQEVRCTIPPFNATLPRHQHPVEVDDSPPTVATSSFVTACLGKYRFIQNSGPYIRMAGSFKKVLDYLRHIPRLLRRCRRQ
jgi:hypothetical protein